MNSIHREKGVGTVMKIQNVVDIYMCTSSGNTIIYYNITSKKSQITIGVAI